MTCATLFEIAMWRQMKRVRSLKEVEQCEYGTDRFVLNHQFVTNEQLDTI